MAGLGVKRRVACVVAAGVMATTVGAVVTTTGVAPVAAQAVNQAPTSSLALVADPAGFDHVFYRGQDSAVYSRTFDDGVWSAQSTVGGRIVGAPALALSGPTLALAARGTDNVLWMRFRTGRTWSAWQNVGGVLSSSPSVTYGDDGRLDVFVRGGDDGIWTRSRPAGGAWSAWSRLDGNGFTSAPAAVATGPGRLDLYVAAADSTVVRRTRASGTWAGWQPLGGGTYSAPAVAWSAATGAVVVVRGTNDIVYIKRGIDGTWTGWQNQGGLAVDAPSAAVTSTGGIDVMVRGRNAAPYARTFRTAWSNWVRAWTPAPPPAPAGSLLGTDWTRIPTTQPVVALTFDAGAGAGGLASIRRTLLAKNVPATFFLTGQWTRNFPALANLVVGSGFLMGNHSDTHPDMRTLSDAAVRSEVLIPQRTIFDTTGADTRPLFRFPFGGVDSRVLGLVNGLGYAGMRWTVDTLGWQGTSGGMTAQRVTDRVVAGLQPGEIVLMHVGAHPTDGSTLDADALPQIIDTLRARGYRFVTLDALVRP